MGKLYFLLSKNIEWFKILQIRVYIVIRYHEFIIVLFMNGKALAALLAILGLFAALIGQAQPKSEVSDFAAWKAKFNMKFESQFEEAYRERIFLENLKKI